MGHDRTMKQVDDELDDISVQTIQLMDDYCSTIGRFEHCLRDGCVNLAKSRYVMGNRSVSNLQLPATGPYVARSTVVREGNDTIRLAHDQDGDDPIRRFGVLVPGSLRTAQQGFCKCLESTIEAMAIKCELEKLREKFSTLKLLRGKMTNV